MVLAWSATNNCHLVFVGYLIEPESQTKLNNEVPLRRRARSVPYQLTTSYTRRHSRCLLYTLKL